MELITEPCLEAQGIVHHCPITGVYVRKDTKGTWTVFRPTTCHSCAYNDSTYRDLSLAVARCDYIAKRMKG